jgi:hypothetical protein
MLDADTYRVYFVGRKECRKDKIGAPVVIFRVRKILRCDSFCGTYKTATRNSTAAHLLSSTQAWKMNELHRLTELVDPTLHLDYSWNSFTGNTPENIDDIPLTSLDLFNNFLSGEIPLSLTKQAKLQSSLSLAHNSLSGQIPTGSQLQSQNIETCTDGRVLTPECLRLQHINTLTRLLHK